MIEISTPIWVKGTVVLYEPKNPHTMIELDAKNEDGQVERWTVEGPFLGRLARYDLETDFLKAGDVIEVCGFVPRAKVVNRTRRHGSFMDTCWCYRMGGCSCGDRTESSTTVSARAPKDSHGWTS